MSSFLNWNFASSNVQASVKNGEYISSESTLLLAGPSKLSHLSGDGTGTFLGSSNSLLPIGIMQNMSMAQNRPVTKLFEIGSKRSYFVPGRAFLQFNASRIMFYGPSLMRVLYALAPERLTARLGTPLNIDPDSNGNGVAQLPQYDDLFQEDPLVNVPGYGGTNNEDNRDFYIDLTSELFTVPFGLCVIMKTAQDKPYGAMYLEDCYLESHQLSMDAGQVVIAESVSGQLDRMAPIQLATSTSTAL